MTYAERVTAGSDAWPRGTPEAGTSFTTFFEQRTEGLVSMAVLLAGSRESAEDLVQEVLLQVYRRWARFDSQEAALRYARTAVVNRSRSRWRRHYVAARKAPLMAVDARYEQAPSAEATVMLAEQRRQILNAVAGLPRRQREVLVLRYWLDLSERQISDVLGVHAGTVKSAASRGLATIGRAVGEDSRA